MDFFAEKEGYLISLNSQLEELTTLQAFAKHMKDIIDYRTADYFRKGMIKTVELKKY